MIELLVPGAPTFATPNPTRPIVARLLALNAAWQTLLTLTTFVLTFFVGQCYACAPRHPRPRSNGTGPQGVGSLEADQPLGSCFVSEVRPHDAVQHRHGTPPALSCLQTPLCTVTPPLTQRAAPLTTGALHRLHATKIRHLPRVLELRPGQRLLGRLRLWRGRRHSSRHI